MAREVWGAHQDGGIGSGGSWEIRSNRGGTKKTHTSDGYSKQSSSGCVVCIVAGLLSAASVIPTLLDIGKGVT